MEVDQARRLKELDLENQRWKRLVADQALDILDPEGDLPVPRWQDRT